MPRVSLDYDQVTSLPLAHATTIPDDYLDDMGHMNVMWYTHLFSSGTGALLDRIGLSADRMQQTHGGTFALEAHVRYLSEVRVGQEVAIYSRVIGRSRCRYHVMQFMVNRDKRDVSAIFEAISTYVDLQQRKMAALPDDIASAFDELIAAHTALDWPAPTCGVMHS